MNAAKTFRIFRRFASVAVFALAGDVACAQAQAYPNRPVRIVVPAPPGGIVDVMASHRTTRLMSNNWAL